MPRELCAYHKCPYYRQFLQIADSFVLVIDTSLRDKECWSSSSSKPMFARGSITFLKELVTHCLWLSDTFSNLAERNPCKALGNRKVCTCSLVLLLVHEEGSLGLLVHFFDTMSWNISICCCLEQPRNAQDRLSHVQYWVNLQSFSRYYLFPDMYVSKETQVLQSETGRTVPSLMYLCHLYQQSSVAKTHHLSVPAEEIARYPYVLRATVSNDQMRHFIRQHRKLRWVVISICQS